VTGSRPMDSTKTTSCICVIKINPLEPNYTTIPQGEGLLLLAAGTMASGTSFASKPDQGIRNLKRVPV